MADTNYTLSGVSNNDTNYTGSYEITQQSGTIIKFDTDKKYLNKDIWLTLTVQEATISNMTGGSISGTATASANSSTCSISSTTNTSGISFDAKCTDAVRAAVTCSASQAGWVSQGTLKTLSASSATTLTSTTYYINSVSVPANKSFTVTNAGTTTVTANKSGSTTQGTITIKAFPPSSGTTLEDPQTIVTNGRWNLTTVGAAGTYYGKVTIGSGSATPSVVDHAVTTAPKVTGALAGKITTIGTTTQPSGTDGTDYWSITPSTTLTTTGKSSSKAKATITAGYVSAGTPTTAAHTIDIVPERADGAKRYLPKAGITATKTSGSITPTASLTDTNNVTWNQNNLSGIAITANGNGSVSDLNIAANVTNAGYAPQANNYATATNLSIAAAANNATETKYLTGVTIQAPDSGERTFSITVPNGSTTITFVFHVDSNGNVTVTE